MPSYLGMLILILLYMPGVALGVLGIVGLRGHGDMLRRTLSALALVVGVALVAVLTVAVMVDWAPWNWLLGIVLAGLCVAGFVFWVFVLADCLLNESREGNERIVWTLVIVLTLIVGAGLYYFLRRPRRVAEVGR